MGTTPKILMAGAVMGAALSGGIVTANAQYYPPPPYGYGGGYGGGWPTWNGCPPGYTVQGGNCAPYRGPGGVADGILCAGCEAIVCMAAPK